jgi:hypothetical protein
VKPANKKFFPKGRFSSSLLHHIEQIQESYSINTQYENEIMLNDLDLFANQKKSRGDTLNRHGEAA